MTIPSRGRLIAAVLLLLPIVSGCGGHSPGRAGPSYRVPSGAMEPTLRVAEVVTVNVALLRERPPSVGDIVVFHPPKGAEQADGVCGNPYQGAGHPQACATPTPVPGTDLFIKRIVAGPGDRISVINGHVVRNGALENDSSYTIACTSGILCTFREPVVMPPNEYFMLGDNRGESDDSRFWGPVKRAWIVGVVQTH